jgi:hypothetical protein
MKGTVHLNWFPEVKWLISILKRSLAMIEWPSHGKDQRNGRMAGCSITTMCPAMSLCIHLFLTDKNFPGLPQPAYSPDLSPCDFWLFPIFKEIMKGKHDN